jgi:hypothetical protein
VGERIGLGTALGGRDGRFTEGPPAVPSTGGSGKYKGAESTRSSAVASAGESADALPAR